MSGEEQPFFEGNIVSNVIHTSDGASLALTGGPKDFALQNLDNGEVLSNFRSGTNASVLLLDPQGRSVLELDYPDKKTNRYIDRMWDIKTGQLRFTIENIDSILLPAFSPDGKRLAITLGNEQGNFRIAFLDVTTGQEFGHIPWPNSPSAVAFGMQNKQTILAIGDEGGWVRLLDLNNGDVLKEFQVANQSSIKTLAFHPDGTALVVGYTLLFSDTLQIIDASTGRTFFQRQQDVSYDGNSVIDLAFSQDGEALLAKHQFGQIDAWNWKTNQPLQDPGQKAWYNAQGLGVDWQGHWIEQSFANDSITFTDRMTGQILLTWKDPDPELLCQNIWRFAISSDRRYLAQGCDINLIPVWDLSNGTLTDQFEGHVASYGDGFYGVVTGIVFDPYSDLLVTSGYDGTVRFWDPQTGSRLWTLADHTDTVSEPHFSPDGRYLVTFSWDGTLRMWAIQP